VSCVESPLAAHLLDHPMWGELAPYMRIEVYDRDGGHQDPRHRIECRPMPANVLELALSLRVACCTCSEPMHPIRLRRGETFGHAYYAAACPLDVSIRCSRTAQSRGDYERMVDAVRTAERQVRLFLAPHAPR